MTHFKFIDSTLRNTANLILQNVSYCLIIGTIDEYAQTGDKKKIIVIDISNTCSVLY